MGAAREAVKRVVPAGARRTLRWKAYKTRLELRLTRDAVRRGVSPATILRQRLLGQKDHLRFLGVDVASDDPQATYDIGRDILYKGEYDIPGFIPGPGWRVVDVGANVGLFAMLAASRGASVEAYEAHPTVAAHLEANTAAFDVASHHLAVVGEPVEAIALSTHPGRNIRHTITGQDVFTGDDLEVTTLDVPAIPIREVLEQPCSLLKLDCEGAEFDIFPAAGDALRQAERIVAEIHLNIGEPDPILAVLDDAGFEAEPHELHGDMPYMTVTATRRER